MALTVFTTSGTAGSCPKITREEKPVVVLTVAVRGREADIVEMDPGEALRLGASLMKDAQACLRLQPHELRREMEEDQ